MKKIIRYVGMWFFTLVVSEEFWTKSPIGFGDRLFISAVVAGLLYVIYQMGYDEGIKDLAEGKYEKSSQEKIDELRDNLNTIFTARQNSDNKPNLSKKTQMNTRSQTKESNYSDKMAIKALKEVKLRK